MTTTIGEKIIVSLTSYGERLNNLPVILDTIYAQSVLPDKVVLNLAYEEVIPKDVMDYLIKHNVEINKVPDTKVYKKILPTLERYPDDCIISIDDDWLYPKNMIEDFIEVHKKYPDNPISGNKLVLWGMQCHCGCASLVKREYFGEYMDLFNEDFVEICKSDDIFYTFCAVKNGTPYVRTKHEYFTNMQPFQSLVSYSENNPDCAEETHKYLIKEYGDINFVTAKYLALPYSQETQNIISEIDKRFIFLESNNLLLSQKYNSILNSSAFKLGSFLLKPIYWIKKIVNRNK